MDGGAVNGGSGATGGGRGGGIERHPARRGARRPHRHRGQLALHLDERHRLAPRRPRLAALPLPPLPLHALLPRRRQPAVHRRLGTRTVDRAAPLPLPLLPHPLAVSAGHLQSQLLRLQLLQRRQRRRRRVKRAQTTKHWRPTTGD